jgi:hypothetical protein
MDFRQSYGRRVAYYAGACIGRHPQPAADLFGAGFKLARNAFAEVLSD